ncbi:MAG: hypothetical protein ACJZ66_00590 [Parvibaculales bacterium]
MIWQEKFEKAYLVIGLLLASYLFFYFEEWGSKTIILAAIASLLVFMSFRIRLLERKYFAEIDYEEATEAVKLLMLEREMISGAIILFFIAVNFLLYEYTITSLLFFFFAAGQWSIARRL